jgi:hypothetical protein
MPNATKRDITEVLRLSYGKPEAGLGMSQKAHPPEHGFAPAVMLRFARQTFS